MTTIPISPDIIQVNPAVLEAGGGGFALTGLVLTNNTRVPIGTVKTFDSALEVGDFFGLNSHQYSFAQVYFGGYDNATELPGSLLYTQYNPDNVAAWLQGGDVASFTLAQLQAITGNLSVTIDGYVWTATGVTLAAATSPSNAATIIQGDLVAPAAPASATGVVATEASSFTASIGGFVMYVTNLASGTIVPGTKISGTGVLSNTFVDYQLSGTPGGNGTYAVNLSQVVPSTTITGAYGQLTVSGSVTGAFAVGQTLTGSGVVAGTQITALGSGTGGDGTYFVNNATAVASTAVTGNATAPVVTYDSVSGAFIFTSGVRGPASSIAAATGSLATALELSAATGAITSQGANPSTPNAFMSTLIQTTQNWATFTYDYDIDGGPGSAWTQRLAFSLWNSLQNKRYAFIEWDTDPNPANTFPAASSFGAQLQGLAYDGTCPNWEPSDQFLAAFVMGMTAAIDFNATGGRITTAFKSLAGLTAGVTTASAATNLAGNPQVANSFGNGYNFYGAYASANQGFIMYQRGTISGSFVWYDTYVNQIWLNQSFISDLANYLKAANSIPYNAAGYAAIEQVLQDTINTAINAGVIVAGVQLSASQVLAVNQAAGKNIASTLQAQGWYFLTQPTTAAQRAARTSPPFVFYYCDGGSIQAINMASIVVQ